MRRVFSMPLLQISDTLRECEADSVACWHVTGCRDQVLAPVRELVHVLTGASVQMSTTARRLTNQIAAGKSLG